MAQNAVAHLACSVHQLHLQRHAAQGMRLLFGPGSSARNYALEPYAVMAERGVYFLLALTLLAVAVNVVVESQKEPAAG